MIHELLFLISFLVPKSIESIFVAMHNTTLLCYIKATHFECCHFLHMVITQFLHNKNSSSSEFLQCLHVLQDQREREKYILYTYRIVQKLCHNNCLTCLLLLIYILDSYCKNYAKTV